MFGKKGNKGQEDPVKMYASSRTNLLLVIILTVVNIGLYMSGSESIMLFSATIPYYSVVLPLVWGIYRFLTVGIVIAVVFLLGYLVCWIMSKKNYKWLIGALILFVIDTIGMIGLYIWAGEVSGFLDVAIHALILFYLIRGIKYGKQLATPVEVQETDNTETVEEI